MHTLEIMDISFRMPKQTLEDELLAEEANYASTATIQHSSKELVMRMSGKSMYQITFTNSDGDEFKIVAEIDDSTGDIVFVPNRIQNLQKKFFSSSYNVIDNIGDDADPAGFFVRFATMQSTKLSGTFVCYDPNGVPTIIVDGKTKPFSALGIVDDNEHIYSIASAKTLKHAADDAGFHIQKPINVWLQENPAVARAIVNMANVNDKMDYIGQHLITARLNDEIESDEFIDIFRQAGLFGFSKPSVLNIYKLLS